MISWLVRVILALVGVITGWFVSIDAPGFQIMEAAIGMLLIALVIFVLAFWPESWARRLNSIGRNKSGGQR